MKLKAILPTLDDVPEALRELYVKLDDGRFVLSIDGADDLPDVRNVASSYRKERERNGKLTGEYDALKQRLAELGDMDPETLRDLIKKAEELENKKLIDAGQLEELAMRKVQAAERPLRAQIDKLAADLKAKSGEHETLHGRLSEMLIDGALRDAAIKAGVRATAVDDVLLRGRQVYKLVDGAVTPVGKDGLPIPGKATDVMAVEEWLGGLQGAAPHLFEPSSGGAATGNRNTTASSGFKKTLNLSDNKGIGANLEAVAAGEVRFEP